MPVLVFSKAGSKRTAKSWAKWSSSLSYPSKPTSPNGCFGSVSRMWDEMRLPRILQRQRGTLLWGSHSEASSEKKDCTYFLIKSNVQINCLGSKSYYDQGHGRVHQASPFVYSIPFILTLKILATFIPDVCLKHLHSWVLVKRHSIYNQLNSPLELRHIAEHL